MERQTKITKEITRLKNKDALLYAVIKMNSDYYTGYSEIAEEKLSELSNIPVDTIKKHRPDLLKTGIFLSWNYFWDKWGHKRIRYQMEIKPDNYFILKNKFFSDEILDEEEKGFILKLKAITINNTNLILYNQTKIKSLLGIGKNSSIIKTLISKKYIIQFAKDKFYLMTNDLLFTSNEKREYIYRIIEIFCLNKELIPPPFDSDKLNKILIRTSSDKFNELLNKRCTSFEKGDLYEYIFKCFNVTHKEPIKKDENEEYLIL